MAPLVDRLEAAHRQADKIVLSRPRAPKQEGAESLAPFSAAVADYGIPLDHALPKKMSCRRRRGRSHHADWEEIDAAFAGHSIRWQRKREQSTRCCLADRESGTAPLGVGSTSRDPVPKRH
jgi:hypothetical protein